MHAMATAGVADWKKPIKSHPMHVYHNDGIVVESEELISSFYTEIYPDTDFVFFCNHLARHKTRAIA